MGMAKMFPGLFKRGKVYWYQPPTVNGYRPPMYSLDTTNDQEAIARYRDARTMDIKREHTSMPLSKAVEVYHRAKRVSGQHNSHQTGRLYRAVVGKWIGLYGDLPIHQVTHTQAEAFAEHLYETTSQNTQAVYIAILKALFRHFEDKMLIPNSPFRNIQKPRQTPSTAARRFCTAEERDNIIDSAPDRLRTFFIFGFHCGMRISEIVEARHNWLTFHGDKGSITIQDTRTFRVKNGKRHTVPLNKVALAHLKKIKGRPDDYLIAPHRKGSGKGYRFLPLASLKDHAGRCGVADFRTHLMRHSFVTYYFNKGVSLDKIARWIGDTITQVEKTYSHLIPYDDDDINR
jgi:integrase